MQPGSESQPAGIDPAAVHTDRRAIPTIEQFSRRYLDHLRGRHRTFEIHDGCLRDHILPSFGRFRLDELAQSDVAEWLAGSVKADDPATASRLRGIFSYMFTLARRWGVPGADVNPIHRLTLSRPDDRRERCLTLDEVERLRAAAQASHNPQLKYIVDLLLLTRLRMRELLDAQWDNVDLEQRLWRIPSAQVDKVDHVPLSAAAIELIGHMQRWDGCPHVIANPRTRKPYQSFFKSWDAARIKAGLPNVSIHDLRHSSAGAW